MTKFLPSRDPCYTRGCYFEDRFMTDPWDFNIWPVCFVPGGFRTGLVPGERPDHRLVLVCPGHLRHMKTMCMGYVMTVLSEV